MTASVRSKSLDRRRLRTLRELWAWEGKRVVFSNGVFDIIHAGHVELLEKARALGDILVVGLNSDASVRRLKGASRPVNRWKDRAAVLGALACVDFLIGFDEDTPSALIQALRPDVLVKGADYQAKDIAGREHAGRVARLPLKKGYSTTALIERLKKGSHPNI